jgi:hypothetical protein
MRPLAAEERVDLDRLARHRDAELVGLSRERRPAPQRLVVEARARVLLVGVVDHEEPVVVPGNALQRLADLAEVAGEDGVARHLGLPRRVERPGRAFQMRGAADAAGPRGDDETGLRILAAQDDLEPAKEGRLGPGVNHDAVGDLDAHVEIALDPADRRDIKG